MTTEQQIELTDEEKAAELRAVLGLNAGMAFAAGAHIAEPLAWRVGGLRDAVEKLNKRAAKLGIDGVRLVELGTFVVPCEPGFRPLIRTTVAIYGDAPKAAGFSLMARVEHTEFGCLVARSPVGAEDANLEPFFNSKPVCAHCELDRKRKDTFVVREDATGEMKQIGRNCLADYIRSEDAERALQMWKFLYEIDRSAKDLDDFDWGSSMWSAYDNSTLTFVACAASCIRRDGFKKSECDYSTKRQSEFLTGPRPLDGNSRKDWEEGQPTAADYARAETALTWARSNEEQSDYIRNLRIAATLPHVARHGGLLASAPVAYQRSVEKAHEVKREQAPKPAPRGGHVGTVGKREDFGNLTVIRVRFIDNDWGGKTILTAETANGSTLTWFASGSRNFDAGTILEDARGTVKEHGEFRGTPQTVVSRLAWKSIVLPTEKAS